MPSDIAIRVENLGKRYLVGRETPRAATLGGRIRQTLFSPFSWLASQVRAPSEEEVLWALKDVSFELRHGQVLGVIGRNGAGKSTLLKILSRITEPTTGYAEIHGRVGALLEVGTGMHPELTGRENIYLNGTILGMRKAEIDGKFDEIVDFSGVERFLDTPVKRYSSGMRVRLGFAIAAHLEPEILVVDEVLAVGDAEFQKKCLGKMKDVAGHGRTVLFVSHSMAAVGSLCTVGLLLAEGQAVYTGEVGDVVSKYIAAGSGDSLGQFRSEGVVREAIVCGSSTEQSGQLEAGAPLRVRMRLKTPGDGLPAVEIGLGINTVSGLRVSTVGTFFSQSRLGTLPSGEHWVECRIEQPNLAPGSYCLTIAVDTRGERVATHDGVAGFQIMPGDFYGNGKLPGKNQGAVLLKSDWFVA